jgi:hypothetical protein
MTFVHDFHCEQLTKVVRFSQSSLSLSLSLSHTHTLSLSLSPSLSLSFIHGLARVLRGMPPMRGWLVMTPSTGWGKLPRVASGITADIPETMVPRSVLSALCSVAPLLLAAVSNAFCTEGCADQSSGKPSNTTLN